MTPQAKAHQLIHKFSQTFKFSSSGIDPYFGGKLHAKLCVDEIIATNNDLGCEDWDNIHFSYWEQVKAEIEAM